jgi:hypothetical protein
MYLGEMVQYQLSASGVDLLASVLGRDDWRRSPGESVDVAFDAAEATAFEPEG